MVIGDASRDGPRMLSEEGFILVVVGGACVLLVLGVLELLWPTKPRHVRQPAPPRAADDVVAPVRGPEPIAIPRPPIMFAPPPLASPAPPISPPPPSAPPPPITPLDEIEPPIEAEPVEAALPMAEVRE